MWKLKTKSFRPRSQRWEVRSHLLWNLAESSSKFFQSKRWPHFLWLKRLLVSWQPNYLKVCNKSPEYTIKSHMLEWKSYNDLSWQLTQFYTCWRELKLTNYNRCVVKLALNLTLNFRRKFIWLSRRIMYFR